LQQAVTIFDASLSTVTVRLPLFNTSRHSGN